jgi:predicted O-methyltransferase YrrM
MKARSTLLLAAALTAGVSRVDCARPEAARAGAGAPARAPDVPYQPTPHMVVGEMLRLAAVGRGDVVYDLGCGDGRIVIAAAKKGARGVCVDIDPQRIEESRKNALKASVADRITFRTEDLFETPLEDATVVMLFLWPEVNLRLRPKLLRELRPGARIVSHWHDMGDWKPDKEVTAWGSRRARPLYLWTVPAREAAATAPAGADAEKRILSVLEQMRAGGRMYLSVPPEDGRALRLLTEAAGAQTVIEIGTSTGYSGLWFCLALQRTGGRLITFEIDADRAAAARKNFQEAGVEALVTVVEGDAHEKVASLKAPVDVVFIDADKEGYVDYLRKLRPLVRPGGLILAHNVGMAGVADYVREVTTDAGLETIFYREGAGLAVTLKKR